MEIDKLLKVNPGDLFKTNEGKIGIVINFAGVLGFVTSAGKVNISDIVEVRRPSKSCLIDHNSWDLSPIVVSSNKTAFLGISYQADDKLVEKTRNALKAKGYTVIEYDDAVGLCLNNFKVSDCGIHVIVPPESFDQDHIIGYGLYQQILIRQKSGGKTMVVTDCGMQDIKKIYKLEGTDKIKSALVLY